jgi:FkbM family methyltransferase
VTVSLSDVRARLRSIRGAFALRRNEYSRRIATLPILEAGQDVRGRPYVRLTSGRVFFGYLPSRTLQYLYRLFLPRHVKSTLPVECVGVAYDIALRYEGPNDPNGRLSEGKYFDLAAGATVIEVGAYLGYYALRAAELVGPAGRVIAIEAIPENVELLALNIESNPDLRITLVPKAAWSGAGQLSFEREARQAASAIAGVVRDEQVIEVACDSVDAMLAEAGVTQPDFVRVQVNGAEREVLDGMVHTLERRPTVLVAAIYARDAQPSWREVAARLGGMGYRVEVHAGNVFATTH